MLVKELYCNEEVKDFKVKDPETYHKDRANELKKMSLADVEVDGKIEPRPVKVKSVRPKKLQWSEDKNLWEFRCKIKAEILD